MADKYTVEVDVEAPGLDETTEKFTRLQLQIKETKKQLQAAQEAGDSVEFNRLKKELDNLEDKLQVVNIKQKEFHDALSAIPGPAGRVGQALQSLDLAFKTLIANPIVAIIAATAAIFLAMYEALKKTSEGQKALSAVTDAFGRILNPIIKAISAVAIPVFNALATAIDFVSSAFRDFNGTYRDFQQEVANDTAMRQAEANAKRAGEWIEQYGYKYDEFTKKKVDADIKYQEKVAKIYKMEGKSVAERNEMLLDAANEKNKILEEADAGRAKKVSDAQKVESDKSKAAAQKAFSDKIALMGAEDKLDLAKLEKMKAEALATVKTEADKFATESLYATKKYELERNNILQLQGLYKKDSKEYTDYQAQLTTLDAARITQLTSDAEKKKKLKDDEFKGQKEADALLDALYIATIKKEEDREQATFDSNRRKEKVELSAKLVGLKYTQEQIDAALKQFDEGTEILDADRKEKKKQKALQEELELLNIRKGAMQAGTAAYFDLQRQIEENAYQQKKLKAQGNAKELEAIEAEHSANLVNIKKQEVDSYLATASQIIGGVGNILNMASTNMKMQQDIDIANAEGNEEKITEIKKKAFEDNKKMQIAQAIISTLQGAIAAYQSMATIPVVGVGLGIAAAAAALVFGYKNVELIKQTKYTDSSAKGSSSSAKPSTPAFNGTINVPAPVIGASSAQSSGNLGQVIGSSMEANNSKSRPIQAYVVGGQVTTQQQLDRRISVAAKMGG